MCAGPAVKMGEWSRTSGADARVGHRLSALDDVPERHDPRGSQQNARIGRDERNPLQDAVSLAGEKVQEALP